MEQCLLVNLKGGAARHRMEVCRQKFEVELRGLYLDVSQGLLVNIEGSAHVYLELRPASAFGMDLAKSDPGEQPIRQDSGLAWLWPGPFAGGLPGDGQARATGQAVGPVRGSWQDCSG